MKAAQWNGIYSCSSGECESHNTASFSLKSTSCPVPLCGLLNQRKTEISFLSDSSWDSDYKGKQIKTHSEGPLRTSRKINLEKKNRKEELTGERRWA